MILYINDEHCLSVEQLKGYFTEDLTAESPIFSDLLDYGRSGDISEWLKEMEEDEMSGKVASIDNTLSDSEYFIALKKIITGDFDPTPSDSLKPSFEKCFQYEGIKCKQITDAQIVVRIKLKVLQSINEQYKLSARSYWGILIKEINPINYIEGEQVEIVFTFNSKPGKDWNFKGIYVVGRNLLNEKEIKRSNRRISRYIEDFFVENVNGVKFTMRKVAGGMVDCYAFSDDIEEKYIDDFFIGETVVTQELWEEVMKNNPSAHKGKQLPVENVSFYDCIMFCERLNHITGKSYSIPSIEKWVFAARGGNKSRGYKYSGSDNVDEVAWYGENHKTGTTHQVATKQPNELGVYDMSGNVREWCVDYNDWKHAQCGGSYAHGESACTVCDLLDCEFNDASRKDSYCGFRIVLG